MSSAATDSFLQQEWTKLQTLYATTRSPGTQRDVLLSMSALIDRAVLATEEPSIGEGSDEVIVGFLGLVRSACHPAESVSTRSAAQQALSSSGKPLCS